MIGTTIGPYRIVERLGDGGMGAVYRAVDEMLARDVAIKVLRPELAHNPALIERFRLEAVALARLSHARIAVLHGLQKHEGSFLMVMEYVRGETLETLVQRTGRVEWRRAAELCIGVLDALAHAHDMGVVHRDIKPANVMVAHNGAVKVMDFGIARLTGQTRQTMAGHAVGTPTYMAPEQLRGEEVDGRTDLYATGALLFELLTGRVAFEADSDYALMMKQLNEPPPSARTLAPGTPAILDTIITRAMAKRRNDRYADATLFRQALEQALTANGAAAVPYLSLVPDGAAPGAAAAPSDAGSRIAAWAGDPWRGIPAVLERLRARIPGDWRPYAIGGVLALAAVLALPLLRPSSSLDPEAKTDPGRAGVSGTSAAVAPEPGATGSSDAALRPREDASTLLLNRPAPVAVDRTPPVDAGTRPRDSAPARENRRPVEPPPVRSVGSGDRTVSDRPGNDRTMSSEAPPVPSVVPQAANDTENETEIRLAIRDAIRNAAALLSGGNTDAAGPLLGGALHDDWLALMKERRVSMNPTGTPSVQRQGGRASAEFDADVTVRSPFGANRRRSARFSAELQRSGAEWRVMRVHPVGRVELR